MRWELIFSIIFFLLYSVHMRWFYWHKHHFLPFPLNIILWVHSVALIVLSKCDFISYVSTRKAVPSFLLYLNNVQWISWHKFLATSLIISVSKGMNLKSSWHLQPNHFVEKWDLECACPPPPQYHMPFFPLLPTWNAKNWSRPIPNLKAL